MTNSIPKAKVENTVNILMQLDEKSLLLIESGAKLLAARQMMDKNEAKAEKNELQEV